jgi:hypothetical protein
MIEHYKTETFGRGLPICWDDGSIEREKRSTARASFRQERQKTPWDCSIAPVGRQVETARRGMRAENPGVGQAHPKSRQDGDLKVWANFPAVPVLRFRLY